MPAVLIRQSRPGDLEPLVALENRCFAGDRMSRRSYRAALANPRAVILVAQTGQQLAGAAVAFFRADSPAGRLYSIAVAPDMHGRGIGARLLARMERLARQRGAGSLRLEVSTGNKSALALYRKSGYGVIGRIERYYEDGTDAWRLEKPLAAGSVRRRQAEN